MGDASTGTSLSSGIAPGLLLAMPQLLDPNFLHAVVLMIEHGDAGSFGLVINQPSPIKATELLDSLGMSWRGDPDAVVWSGGPVNPSTGWVLHEPIDALRPSASLGDGSTIAIAPGLALTTSPDGLRTIAADPPARTRLLLGYSGWGPGQLAAEMTRGSWLHTDADPALVFDAPTEEIWARAMRTLGIDKPEALVQGHGVH
ncbi:MAG: YqgE/AlgH family protein [Kofleriaceae bacterium]|nr:YqgE/AlgH family protein [Myxococcales bacterium]MCB9560201.1 YqgE/AlgH family protein [Kofleriaceae bacterium]MCB9571236.1 YqgE/AlgH family protein [Kofleriaceae bacterium]